jgi:hypothetical protein
MAMQKQAAVGCLERRFNDANDLDREGIEVCRRLWILVIEELEDVMHTHPHRRDVRFGQSRIGKRYHV